MITWACPNANSDFEGGRQRFRMDNYYIALAADPELVRRFLDKLGSIYMQRLEMYLKAVGSYIDAILLCDDYGMQAGLPISPDMFREFFKPRHALRWQTAERLAPVKVLPHSRGTISSLLPDMLDAGLDAVNPVQTNCRNMEPDRPKVCRDHHERQPHHWQRSAASDPLGPDRT